MPARRAALLTIGDMAVRGRASRATTICDLAIPVSICEMGVVHNEMAISWGATKACESLSATSGRRRLNGCETEALGAGRALRNAQRCYEANRELLHSAEGICPRASVWIPNKGAEKTEWII